MTRNWQGHRWQIPPTGTQQHELVAIIKELAAENEALLEALKGLLEHPNHKPDCVCVYHENARAAIAKAEGR